MSLITLCGDSVRDPEWAASRKGQTLEATVYNLDLPVEEMLLHPTVEVTPKSYPPKLTGTPSSWSLTPVGKGENFAKLKAGVENRAKVMPESTFFQEVSNLLAEFEVPLTQEFSKVKGYLAFRHKGVFLQDSPDEAAYRAMNATGTTPGRCIVPGCTATHVSLMTPYKIKGILWGSNVNSEMEREPWQFKQSANIGLCPEHYLEKVQWAEDRVIAQSVGKDLVFFGIPATSADGELLEQVLPDIMDKVISLEEIQEALKKRKGIQGDVPESDIFFLICGKNNGRAGVLDLLSGSLSGFLQHMVDFGTRFKGLSFYALVSATSTAADSKTRKPSKIEYQRWLHRLLTGGNITPAESSIVVYRLIRDITLGKKPWLQGVKVDTRLILLEDIMLQDPSYEDTPAYNLGLAWGALMRALPDRKRIGVANKLHQLFSNPAQVSTATHRMVAMLEAAADPNLYSRGIRVYRKYLGKASPLNSGSMSQVDIQRVLKGFLDMQDKDFFEKEIANV